MEETLCLLLLFALFLLSAACSKYPQLPPLAADATTPAFGDSHAVGTGASESESYPQGSIKGETNEVP